MSVQKCDTNNSHLCDDKQKTCLHSQRTYHIHNIIITLQCGQEVPMQAKQRKYPPADGDSLCSVIQQPQCGTILLGKKLNTF